MDNLSNSIQDKKKSAQDIWEIGEAQEKKPSFFEKRLFLIPSFVLIVSVMTAGLIFFLRQDYSSVELAERPKEAVSESNPEADGEKLPILETEKGLDEKYRSENFQISHISFGGDTAVASGDSEKLPIEIYGVKAEPFLNEKDGDSRIAISWKSNKLTASELTYSLAGGGGAETIKEKDFGFNHNIILDSLEGGSPYIFSFKSYDRWGNSKPFGYYGTYSSARADSIFELIGKTFGETFGWALDR